MKPIRGQDRLPEHVWLYIFGHLKRPVPPPLSAPPHTDLHSHDLCSVARACKLFHSLAIPLIYKTAIVDEFLLFLWLHNLVRVRSYLKHTEQIFIEYWEKHPSIPYYRLLNHGDRYWEAIGETEDAKGREMMMMMECDMEVSRYIIAFDEVGEWATRDIFPSLKTISVGSIYGRQTDIWSRYEKWKYASRLPSAIDRVVKLWERFLSTSGAQSVCIRDSGGPLSLRPISQSFEDDDNPDPQYTIHFDANVDTLCARFNGPGVRWVSDVPLDTAFYPTFQRIMRPIAQLKGMMYGRFFREDDDVVDIDVYYSTSVLGEPDLAIPNPLPLSKAGFDVSPTQPLSEQDQRVMLSKIGTTCQRMLNGLDDWEDTVRWHLASDAPVCQASGSGPPVARKTSLQEQGEKQVGGTQVAEGEKGKHGQEEQAGGWGIGAFLSRMIWGSST